MIFSLGSYGLKHFNLYAPAAEQSLKEGDFSQLRKVWHERQGDSKELRRKVLEKKMEIVDLIASNPEDLVSTNCKVNDLVLLEGQLQREILTTMSKMMASLPAERRHLFLKYLKQRSREGQGMGVRHSSRQRFPSATGNACPILRFPNDKAGGD
jgi:Spy/CpxP family protein refolding chaperone